MYYLKMNRDEISRLRCLRHMSVFCSTEKSHFADLALSCSRLDARYQKFPLLVMPLLVISLKYATSDVGRFLSHGLGHRCTIPPRRY